MNVLIVPGSGVIDFNSLSVGTSTFGSIFSSSRVTFQNGGELNIYSRHSGHPNRFSVDGTDGRLLTAQDPISGLLFSVSDIAGRPVAQFYDNTYIELGGFNSGAMKIRGGRVGIGVDALTERLEVGNGKARFAQIGNSGHNGNAGSYALGDVWFNSKDGALAANVKGVPTNLALGKTFATFRATDAYASTISGARTGVLNATKVLLFDAVADNSTNFIGIVPSGICLQSGIIAKVYWAAGNNDGNVIWGASFEKCNTSILSDSFSSVTSATTTTNPSVFIPSVTNLNCTNIDGVAGGDLFRVRVMRDADNVGDTMTGDAALLMLELQSIL